MVFSGISDVEIYFLGFLKLIPSWKWPGVKTTSEANPDNQGNIRTIPRWPSMIIIGQ